MNTEHAPPTMPATVDLTGLPPEFVAAVQHLVDAVRHRPATAAPTERKPLLGRFNRPAPWYTPEMLERDRREVWGTSESDAPEGPS